MKSKFLVAAAVAAVGSMACAQFVVRAGSESMPAMAHQMQTGVPAVLNFKMKSLGGQEVDLAKYKGKVILIVNTASKCGFTPQYKGLEELHEKYADKGLVILGFPSNDFNHQEPGSDTEISTFCTVNYGVKFDMFSKVDVKGPNICPLYKYLITTDAGANPPVDVAWNFEKFLIGRDGHIAGRYKSAITPMSPELTGAIETQLAK